MAHQANGHNYEFYGKDKTKSKRRSNGGRPRKMYPYVTAKQKGTPMERMILSQYAELQEQYNELNRGPGKMFAEESHGTLGSRWKNMKRRMTSGSSVVKHIRENGGTVGQARKELEKMTEVDFGFVSFGADPSNR